MFRRHYCDRAHSVPTGGRGARTLPGSLSGRSTILSPASASLPGPDQHSWRRRRGRDTLAIVIEEAATGTVTNPLDWTSRLCGYVPDRAVAEIQIKAIRSVVSDQQVRPAVVFIIADTDSLAPAFHCKSGILTDFGEPPWPSGDRVAAVLGCPWGRPAWCRSR